MHFASLEWKTRGVVKRSATLQTLYFPREKYRIVFEGNKQVFTDIET